MPLGRLALHAHAPGHRPQLIMLDEPAAGLNSEDTRRAIEIIRRVTRGKTLVMVEHDMDAVFSLANRISVIY